MTSLAKLRLKVGYLLRRFYGLDAAARNAIRDRRLQMATLSFAITRVFKMESVDHYPEFSR